MIDFDQLPISVRNHVLAIVMELREAKGALEDALLLAERNQNIRKQLEAELGGAKQINKVLSEQLHAVRFEADSHVTTCAQCRARTYTPLRRDDMGGYVCLKCINDALSARAKGASFRWAGEENKELAECKACIRDLLGPMVIWAEIWKRDYGSGVAAPEHLKAIALAKRLSEAPTDAGKGGGK